MLKRKKLNNKGVTLVELIVSFALVTLAVIYFYQTLTTVTKMYANAKKDTKKASDKNYALRLISEYIDSAHSFIIDIKSYDDGDPTVLVVEKKSELEFRECFNEWYDKYQELKVVKNTPGLFPRGINVQNYEPFKSELFKDIDVVNNAAKKYMFSSNYEESTINNNPRIIQEILYYMNYNLKLNNITSGTPYSFDHIQQFSSWNCTYEVGSSNPLGANGNCLFEGNARNDASTLSLSSASEKKQYFISYVANSNYDDASNIYNYKNGCFKQVIHNGESKNIDEIDVWIPVRLQNSNLNGEKFNDKFDIKSKGIAYNPKRKLIKWQIEYNGTESTYYKFYNQNNHNVVYYSSWMFGDSSTPKEFTMFLAKLN